MQHIAKELASGAYDIVSLQEVYIPFLSMHLVQNQKLLHEMLANLQVDHVRDSKCAAK